MKIHNHHIVLTTQTPIAKPSQANDATEFSGTLGTASSSPATESILRLHQIALQNAASSHTNVLDANQAIGLAKKTQALILEQGSSAAAAQSGHAPEDVFKLLQP